MRFYFTSDYHLNHERIIKYCNRPFSNVEQMNFEIIDNHNQIVTLQDVVFYLGDFCFKDDDFEGKLNGKFILIEGNHDHRSSKKAIIRRIVINHGGKNILLVHRPQYEVDSNIDLVLCGHVHNNWRVDLSGDVPIVNVGVDVWNFRPVEINDVLARLAHYQK